MLLLIDLVTGNFEQLKSDAENIWNNIKEARTAIKAYIHKYNFERCHSAIGNVPPATLYYPAMLYEAAKNAA